MKRNGVAWVWVYVHWNEKQLYSETEIIIIDIN